MPPFEFRSRPDGAPVDVLRDGQTLLAKLSPDAPASRWTLRELGGELVLHFVSSPAGAPDEPALLAVIETSLSAYPDRKVLRLKVPGLDTQGLERTGVVLRTGDDLRAERDLFWQQARLWLPEAPAPFPLRYAVSEGKRHPVRPPKRSGVVYQRFIPWLNQTFSFRAFDIEADLERFNRWMNDPVVAQFWQEEGDLAKHRAYAQTIADDPHMQSLIACLDDQPFAYFEVYWAKENRIGPFYDVDDYDRGWHVLVGESACRGKQFATAWLTSISHYLFLDDPRTQRVVGEPRADHAQQIRNLDRSGFAKIKEFDFPHKRAMLISMLRERYFGERLWLPRDEPVQPAAAA